jgi:hypothetical protein
VEVVETPVVVGWGQNDVGSFCFEDVGVDTFLVDVFAVEGTAPDESSHSRCRYCGVPGSGVSCSLMQRRCLCGGFRTTAGGFLEVFEGLSIDDVAVDAPLCVRIVALRRGTNAGVGATEGPAEPCAADVVECDPSWLQGIDTTTFHDRVDLCGVSDAVVPGGAAAPIVVREISCRRVSYAWAAFAEFDDHLRDRFPEGQPADDAVEELIDGLCARAEVLCDGPDEDIGFESCAVFVEHP